MTIGRSRKSSPVSSPRPSSARCSPSWRSVTSPPIARRPRAGSNACGKPCKISWSRSCACARSPPSPRPRPTCRSSSPTTSGASPSPPVTPPPFGVVPHAWHSCREVRERLDGLLQVFHHDQLIAEQAWVQPGFILVPRSSATPRRRTQLGIDLPGSRQKPDRPAPRLKTRLRKAGIGHYTNRRKPTRDHPWNHEPGPETAPAGGT